MKKNTRRSRHSHSVRERRSVKKTLHRRLVEKGARSKPSAFARRRAAARAMKGGRPIIRKGHGPRAHGARAMAAVAGASLGAPMAEGAVR